MFAVHIHPETRTLFWAETDTPAPGPGAVRIRVHATAANRADLMQRAGHYDPPPGASPILGLECAGVIDAIGEGVDTVAIGDRVCALLAGGGYAEQVVCPATQVMPIPGERSFAEAAAIPEVYTTAWLNLYREGRLRPGERVLLHAGASGVGTAAIQLLRRSGNPCMVSVGSQDKMDRCLALGAMKAINRHETAFVDAARTWTGGQGVDVILDPVGASYLGDNLKALAVYGRMVLIGLLGGRHGEIDLGRVLVRRLRIVGSVLRARSIAEKAEILAAMQADIWPDLAAGSLKPIIDQIFPIQDAEAAHQRMKHNHNVGKIILTIVSS
ncbi:MAG: NAD(P)H-quinone oxidoreductase [Myxococcota bacterium]